MRRALHKYVLIAVALSCSRDKSVARDTAYAEASARNAPSVAVPTTDHQPPTTAGLKTVLFIGTSLTAGYGLDPDSAYPQQVGRMIDSAGLAYEVVNAGVSGETSSALLRRLDWLLRQPFAVVVIETGANDGLRGIPVETMRNNVQQILDRIRMARPDARIALVQMESPPNLGAAYTREFRKVFPDLSKANGTVLLPFLLENVAGNRELNQADGIHPNYDGERIVARNVWKGLRPLLQ